MGKEVKLMLLNDYYTQSNDRLRNESIACLQYYSVRLTA